jgi:hypothetical protein
MDSEINKMRQLKNYNCNARSVADAARAAIATLAG